MADLRDSGSIEQDANVVILLHGEETDNTYTSRDVSVIIAKCRGDS